MIPENNVWLPGIGSVPADQLNTYEQVVLNYPALRNFTGNTYMIVQVLGAATPGDGGQGVYWYNANSTATDNNSTVIVPNGNIQGAWLQLPVPLPATNINVRYVSTGTADTALSSDSVIVWNSPIAAAKTEILPAPTTRGQTFTVKDGLGNAAEYPITISAVSGTFLGETQLSTPYAALTFTADGVSHWLVTQGYLPETYTVYDAWAWGIVGNGVTDNTLLMQALFTQAGLTGGLIRFQPGVFKITAEITATINSGVGLRIVGSGMDVTEFLCSACNGFGFTFGSAFSSLSASNATFVTDQVGGFTALSATLATGVTADSSNAYGPFNSFENISYRGDDLSAAHTHFWGTGFFQSGLSNINIIGGGFNGPAASGSGGTGYSLNGNSSIPFYSVVINFYGVSANTAAIGVVYGDWVQGVTFDACNFTGCAVGIQTPTSPAGTPDQLSVINSQFNCTSIGVNIRSANFNGAEVCNNNFIVPANATGLVLRGTNFCCNDNIFGASSTTGSIAIDIPSTFGNSGLLASNSVAGFGTGFRFGASAASVFCRLNQFVMDAVQANDYVMVSGSGGITITDATPRNYSALPVNTTAINYSTFLCADCNVVSFRGVVTAGGGGAGNVGFLIANGGAWIYH